MSQNKKFDLNSQDEIMRRFDNREISDLERQADAYLDRQDGFFDDPAPGDPNQPVEQKQVPGPQGGITVGQSGAMTAEMRRDHISAISIARIMSERNPKSELWAIELLDLIANRQYFKVVNSDQARKDMPKDMDEKTFQTVMIDTVVKQLKAEEGIPVQNAFYCLFVADAHEVAKMNPEQMHRLYMAQIIKLKAYMESAKNQTQH